MTVDVSSALPRVGEGCRGARQCALRFPLSRLAGEGDKGGEGQKGAPAPEISYPTAVPLSDLKEGVANPLRGAVSAWGRRTNRRGARGQAAGIRPQSAYLLHTGGCHANRRRLCGVANAPLWGVPRRRGRHLAGEPAAPRSRLPRQTSQRERSRAAGVPGHASRRHSLPNATLASVQLAAGAPTRTDDACLLDAAAPLRGRSRTGSRRARVRRVAGEPAARRRTGDTRPAGGGLHLGRNRHTVGR